MRSRPLGQTGIEVSELGFGCWAMGKQFWKGSDDTQSLGTLKAALGSGVNFMDTALGYGRGHSEQLVGQALRETEADAFLATKIPPKNFCWPAQGSLADAFPPDHIQHAIELSLENLGRERIDLIQLHVWHPAWIQDPRWFDELSRLRAEGQVRFIGVSTNDHDPESVIELVESGLIDTVQVIYNIFDQSPADRLFQICQDRGVGVIARVPFDEGGLTGNVNRQTRFPKKDWRNRYFGGARRKQVEERVEALRSFLGGGVETLPELALRFCLSHPAVSTVIPGMRSIRHLQLNLAAASKGILPRRQVEELAGHRWEKNFYLY